MAALALLVAPAAQAGTFSILQWFQDGCAQTKPSTSLVQICERGARAGAPCRQMPEFDPGSPKFSTDCCISLEHPDCNTNNPDTFCSDPAVRRTCTRGATGIVCVTNEGCDTGICTKGDEFLVGDSCTLDSECGVGEDPNTLDPVPGVCGSAQNGVCGAPEVDSSESKIGQVLMINDDVALLAIVVGIIETAQPSYRADKRRMPDLEFELFEAGQFELIDDQICALAAQLGPLSPPSRGAGDGNSGDPNSF
jgi:hypothetical protein